MSLKSSVCYGMFFLFVFYKMQLNTSLRKGPLASVPGVPLTAASVAVGEVEVVCACVLPALCWFWWECTQTKGCVSHAAHFGREGGRVPWGMLPSQWACGSEHTLMQYQSWAGPWPGAPCSTWDQEACGASLNKRSFMIRNNNSGGKHQWSP